GQDVIVERERQVVRYRDQFLAGFERERRIPGGQLEVRNLFDGCRLAGWLAAGALLGRFELVAVNGLDDVVKEGLETRVRVYRVAAGQDQIHGAVEVFARRVEVSGLVRGFTGIEARAGLGEQSHHGRLGLKCQGSDGSARQRQIPDQGQLRGRDLRGRVDTHLVLGAFLPPSEKGRQCDRHDNALRGSLHQFSKSSGSYLSGCKEVRLFRRFPDRVW